MSTVVTPLLELLAVLIAFPIVLSLVIVSTLLCLRPINEITTRTVGRAVVVCPHCGTPGVVKSRNPRVIR